MPKLITTQTRIADLGKPRIFTVSGGPGGWKISKALKDLKAKVVLFGHGNHSLFQSSFYPADTIARDNVVNDPKTLKFQGFIAWLVWVFIQLVSIIGFKNKILTLLMWMWSYFSFDKSNRLMIDRPKEDI